jgi:predicted kinase
MSKSNIIILIGIPASGKSTWTTTFLAENPNWVSISRDAFRFALRNEPFLRGNGEKLITQLVNDAIKTSVDFGYNVIVDQTNVNPRYFKELLRYCNSIGEVSFKVFDIDFDTAVERDRNRERSVGVHIINKMYENFQEFKLTDTYKDVVLENQF